MQLFADNFRRLMVFQVVDNRRQVRVHEIFALAEALMSERKNRKTLCDARFVRASDRARLFKFLLDFGLSFVLFDVRLGKSNNRFANCDVRCGVRQVRRTK